MDLMCCNIEAAILRIIIIQVTVNLTREKVGGGQSEILTVFAASSKEGRYPFDEVTDPESFG